MRVRGQIEGGGEFVLGDKMVERLRYMADRFGDRAPAAEHTALATDLTLAAALPPEPYEPKVGDRVQYLISGTYWSDGVYEYRGLIDDRRVLRRLNFATGYFVLDPRAELRLDTRDAVTGGAA